MAPSENRDLSANKKLGADSVRPQTAGCHGARSLPRPFLPAASLWLLLQAVTTVDAQPSPAAGASEAAEVLVILAREDEGTVDESLAGIAALRRPPFNAFHALEVLAKPTMTLRQNHAQVVPLPNGRRLQIELQQVLPDGRFRVRVSINRPEQNDYLPLLTVVAAPGDPFFVAGQHHLGGTLIVGVRVGTRVNP